MQTTSTREVPIPADIAGIAEYLVEAVAAGTTDAAQAAEALKEWLPGDAAEEIRLADSAARLLALAANAKPTPRLAG
jgi:hypothetical protein